jgi:hypothetical protein
MVTASRLAAAAATTVACSKGNVTPSTTTAAPTRAAADRFVAAWRRSLEASWSVDESVERSTALGGHLVFSVHRAQRPPDRVNVGLGSADARQGDQLVTCAPGAGGKVTCAKQRAANSYQREVDVQMAALSPYVSGPEAVYAVSQVAGCFQLTLRLPGYPVPPYGQTAVFCFDPGTGAPAGSVIVRNEGTDRTRVVAAHVPARDADLVLPDPSQLQQSVP